MNIDSQIIFSRIKKYPLLSACCVISAALALTLYFRSSLLSEQKIELEKYSLEAKRHQNNVTNSAHLADQLNFLIQANSAVKVRGLTVEGVADKLQFFYRLESETGVKYLDLRAGSKVVVDKKKPATYVPLNYILSVQGDFGQVVAFLRKLEQGVYFCRITSASLSGSGSSVKISMKLDLLGVP
jgi:hypothetical protein